MLRWLLYTVLLSYHYTHPFSQIEDVSSTGGSGTGERIRSMENVVTFLKSVRALGLPYTNAFNMPDLEATGPEERPRVAECILALKRLHERIDLKTVALPMPPPSATPTPAPIAAARAAPAAATPAAATPDVLPMDAARAVVADKGGRGADGVLSLMNQCTSMLKHRMMLNTPTGGGGAPAAAVPRAAPDAAALDTVGPVLESVLGNLTQVFRLGGVGVDDGAHTALVHICCYVLPKIHPCSHPMSTPLLHPLGI